MPADSMHPEGSRALLAVGLAVGLLATGARRWFAEKRLWLGGALAALILLPNLVWQVQND